MSYTSPSLFIFVFKDTLLFHFSLILDLHHWWKDELKVTETDFSVFAHILTVYLLLSYFFLNLRPYLVEFIFPLPGLVFLRRPILSTSTRATRTDSGHTWSFVWIFIIIFFFETPPSRLLPRPDQADLVFFLCAMRIFVKTVDGRTVPVTAFPRDTVRTLKSKISDEIRFPADQQKLVFTGELTVSVQCNRCCNCMVDVQLNLRIPDTIGTHATCPNYRGVLNSEVPFIGPERVS